MLVAGQTARLLSRLASQFCTCVGRKFCLVLHDHNHILPPYPKEGRKDYNIIQPITNFSLTCQWVDLAGGHVIHPAISSRGPVQQSTIISADCQIVSTSDIKFLIILPWVVWSSLYCGYLQLLQSRPDPFWRAFFLSLMTCFSEAWTFLLLFEVSKEGWRICSRLD